MTTIAQAVEPLKAEAEQAAREHAAAAARRVYDALEAAGWDIDLVVPRPHGHMSKAEYRQAAAKRAFYERLTTWTKPVLRHGEPNIRKFNPEAVVRYIEDAAIQAAVNFNAYVTKLEQKIGEHSAASLSAFGGVWGYSILTVETPVGKQSWKTQQIMNVSCLGTLFNQWPTRLVK